MTEDPTVARWSDLSPAMRAKYVAVLKYLGRVPDYDCQANGGQAKCGPVGCLSCDIENLLHCLDRADP